MGLTLLAGVHADCRGLAGEVHQKEVGMCVEKIHRAIYGENGIHGIGP